MKRTTANRHSRREQRRLDRIVCDVFGITLRELHRNTTLRTITDARLTAMYLQKELLRLSHPAIARYFNKKAHATSINAHKTISGLVATDPLFGEKVSKCKQFYQEYTPCRTKQRYNLHYQITQAGIKVSGPEKTIYIPASKQQVLDGILKDRIERLARKHNYSLQLTID